MLPLQPLLRLLRPATAGHPVSSRIRPEVCPPSMFETSPSGFARWLGKLVGGSTPADAAGRRLQEVRDEFAYALAGIGTQHASFLQHRARHARSLRDLWLMRAEVYGVIAVATCEAEAERRIAGLNRFFPTRSPRSGFAPLQH